jgi:hypothetical protein
MTSSAEFLAGILERADPFVTCEDFDGPAGPPLPTLFVDMPFDSQ